MPLLWDYLLAPWRIFSASSTTGSAPPPLSPGLCSMETIGDEVLSVCHVLGYTMPSFILWASLLILALFVASSVTLLFQCHQLADSLWKVSAQLKKISRTANRGLTPADLGAIDKIMSTDKILNRSWLRFEETLLVSPTSPEIFASHSAEESFAKGNLIEEHVHSAFFNSVPGILTGVGLLMTFVAILDGLSHVSVAANMDVKGIGGLINGLSGKFVSSVTAVTCAVLFVFVERIAYSKPTQAYYALTHEIGSLFRRKTTAQLLYEIQGQLARKEG